MYGNGYGYGYGNNMFDSGMGSLVWGGVSIVIAIIVALIIAIVCFATIMKDYKENTLTGFPLWLHKFLNFKILIIEPILKFIYVVATTAEIIWFVLNMFNSTFFIKLITMIIVVIITRVCYELSMLTVLLVKNVIQINHKLKGDAGDTSMFSGSFDLLKKAPMQQGYNQPYMQPQAPVQPQAPIQPQAPVQPQQPVQPQAPVQPQQFAGFCTKCGTPLDPSTGKCPNCDK